MTTVLIVDDHALVRGGIRALLQLHPEIEVVGEAGTGAEGVRLARQLRPDVILMDIGLPDVDGLSAMQRIVEGDPHARVIILTQHENREYVLPALKGAASGYLLKRAPDDRLITAIRTVASGGSYLDPNISNLLIDDLRHDARGSPADLYDLLTDREREIAVLLAKGLTYQEAADLLFVSAKTVGFHRTNLMRKLDLSSRAELTRFAVERGLL